IPDKIAEDAVGWFSYSLTEIKNPLELLLPFDHLVILEPSTQKDSQSLIDLRDLLIQNNYEILAPCTHQMSCPLKGNRSDWCHDKIYVDLPDSMKSVERELKWENSNLTFSYLIASRKLKNSKANKVRVVG